MKKAIVIGGTGATGRQLIRQLILSDNWDKITSIGRTPALNVKNNHKLENIIIENLFDLSSTEELWSGHDVFFNCIGTTRYRAGSAKQFVNIEVGISNEAAKLASSAGIPHASLISASGANFNQFSVDWIHPLLYIKTMGQKEQTVIEKNFSKVSIYRPGMLIRLLKDETQLEKIVRLFGMGMRVDNLAKAMLIDAEHYDVKHSTDESVLYFSNKEINQIIN